MNEEEFREILLNLGYKFDINKREEEFCLLCIKKGFQKGKLEVLNNLNETYPDLKTQEDRKIFVKWKEQLQKEIGEGKC